MPDYELTPDGLTTGNDVIIAMLKGHGPCVKNVETGEWYFPKSAVKSAIEPVEGDWAFYFAKDNRPMVDAYLIPHYGTLENYAPRDAWIVVKACPLTTGKTVAELRALVAWMNSPAKREGE